LLAAEAPMENDAPEPAAASEPSEVTETGLPRRKRHSATVDTQPLPPVLSTEQPRAGLAAAWQSGAHGIDTSASGTAAPSDPAEAADAAEGTR
jgi:hypothetical protein